MGCWFIFIIFSRRDFIVFRLPDEPPVSITENGFPDKVQTNIRSEISVPCTWNHVSMRKPWNLFLLSCQVRLCFLNGNHYDSVYPQSFEKSAAVCQCTWRSHLTFFVINVLEMILKHICLSSDPVRAAVRSGLWCGPQCFRSVYEGRSSTGQAGLRGM